MRYKVDPEVFLQKPLSEVIRHMAWTAKLAEIIDEEAEWASRG